MFPTRFGVLVLLLSAPLIALGTFLPALEWSGWSLALLAVAAIYLDWRLAGDVRRFEIRREHEPRLSLGVENAIQLHLRNRLGRHAAVLLRDEAPEQFKISQRILPAQVPAHSAWQGVYHVRPLHRGDYQFGDINLRWRGPLGLVIRQGKVKAAESVKVYPNLLDLRRYDLLLRRNRLQEMGLRHTRQFGEGTEFERLREYIPDDDFRRIDWKATARRSRPITVEYQIERSQNVMAVLDTGRMMQSPVAQIAKLDYVVNAVLLLAYVATGKGDLVGMMTFADDVNHYLRPRQGRGQFYQMLELLYAVKAHPVEPDYRKALSYLALKQRKRSLVVIFTDLSGGISIQTLVQQTALLARSSLPLVVTISDPAVHAASRQKPTESLQVYQRAAAVQVLEERQITLDTLRRQGVLTLDVPANQISTAVINRYLELKGKTLI